MAIEKRLKFLPLVIKMRYDFEVSIMSISKRTYFQQYFFVALYISQS